MIVQLVRYWLFAVNEVLPGWLILPGLRKKWSRSFVVKKLPVSDGLIDKRNLTGFVDIWLEESCFLVRDVPVPRVGRKKIAGILDMNLLQAFPESAKNMRTRAYRQNDDLYRQLVIKDTQLDQIRKYIEARGAKIRRISILGHRDMDPLVDYSSKTDKPVFLWWVFACTCILFAFAFQLSQAYVELMNAEKTVAGLQVEVTSQRALIVEALKRAEIESEEFASVSALTGLFNDQALRTHYLVGLTKSLPDEVWVSEFSVCPSPLKLGHYTGCERGI